MKLKISRVRLFEFFIVGLLLGVIEDLLAIWLATDSMIDLRVILIAALVALPFAFVSEIVVDLRHLPAGLKRFLKMEEESIFKRLKF
ncbi:MAG: hypothetical protein WD187_03600 [Candidatus Woykebacteria bacterium]